MKAIVRAMIEEQIKNLEVVISMLCDDLDLCVEALEELIEVPEEAPEPEPKTKQELLEDELEELLNKYCFSANFYTTDNLTIAAVMVEGVPFPNVGVAKCCPTDEFNETEGDIIALRRALGLPVDPEQYGTPKIEKDCANCKYHDLEVFSIPCCNCCDTLMEDDEDPEFWEAVDAPDTVKYDGVADEDHDCDTCKYDKGTSINQEPCKKCLKNGEKPICWEPIEDEEEDDCCAECTACNNPCDSFKEFLKLRPDIAKELEEQSKQEVPVEKRCITCEYSYLNLFAQPCFGCLNGAITKKGDRPNWELKI